MACIQTSNRLLAVVNKHESGTHQHIQVKVWVFRKDIRPE